MAEDQCVEHLTPLDLLMPGGYVEALLVFPTTEPSPTLLAKLQNSLEAVCKKVPWLTGRVIPVAAVGGQKSGLKIGWTAAGDTTPQIFNKGIISATYKELSRARFPLEKIPTDIWPAAVRVQAEPGSEDPVFASSFFRFADAKAVGLCVKVHHNVVDGFGFAEIIRLWSQCLHGASLPNINPHLGRNRRLADALGKNSDVTTQTTSDMLFQKHPEYSMIPPKMPTEFAACTSVIFTIPMAKIQNLKERLKPYLGTTPTTNNVACTLIWSAITRARMSRTPDLDGKTSRLPMAVNGRKRLAADLLDRENPYLGNVVLFSYAEMAARDVSRCGQGDSSIELLADACRIVAQAQSPDRIDANHIREVYNLVESLDDHRSIFPGWELFGSRDLFITSWADLDFYELDFGDGLGRPEFVRIPYAQADGNVIVLPRKRSVTGAASSQALEVVVMLQRDDLEVLKKDNLWKDL